MKFPNYYMKKEEKLDLLQRWILVHSCLYYDMDTNVVSDYMFDQNAKQLYQMRLKWPVASRMTRFGYVFLDFEGSSGYGLCGKLRPEHFKLIQRDAMALADLRREG